MAAMETSTLSSSSTIRTVPLLIFGWSSDRQGDGEGGPLARPAPHVDLAAVAADDAVGDPEPQAGALLLLLGGEERLEDVRQVLRRDTGAGIANLQLHPAGSDDLRVAATGRARGDHDRATVGHCLLGIEQQV